MTKHNRCNNNKTKREVLSETIALLLFVILSFAIKAHDTEFITSPIRTDTINIHLTASEISKFESISDTEVRSKLDGIIDYDKLLFSKPLDDTCNNHISRLMFT
jgi:hypothetical protein